MTKKLYEVCAKGERLPESHPNSTCKTWRLITALYYTTSARAAEFMFEEDYVGEYLELLPHTKEIPESSDLYKKYMEMNPITSGGGNIEPRAE